MQYSVEKFRSQAKLGIALFTFASLHVDFLSLGAPTTHTNHQLLRSARSRQLFQMENIQSPKKKERVPPRSRKSIAHMPTLAVNNEKENVTVNLAVPSTSIAQGNVAVKKPRSKSIGPGGIDVLKEDAGNRRQVV